MTLKTQQQKQVGVWYHEAQGHTVDKNFSLNGAHKSEVTQG